MTLEKHAAFTEMENGTAEDWRIIVDAARPLQTEYVDRIMAQLRALDEEAGGFAVGRLEHCLQTATRAFRDGRDDEYVTCALLHDIGDLMCPTNHADMAAAMLKPYVSAANLWMVQNHTAFQGYYYAHSRRRPQQSRSISRASLFPSNRRVLSALRSEQLRSAL